MSVYDEKLRRLYERIARKAKLETMLRELRTQREELRAKVSELEELKLAEQADVDRLEGGSLSSIIYSLLGKSEEKLSKERREAAAAAVKYEAAARELAIVADEIERYEAELSGLEGCEREYEAAMEARKEELKRSGGEAAQRILRLETEAASCESRKKEILEAIAAGSDAMVTADEILNELGSAEGWATWDMFGGGLISDLAKHSHLDEAQYMVERLQAQLGRFRTELADVGGIFTGSQVNIDGFLRFADYFFDGIFVDVMVMSRISESIEQVENTREQIDRVLSRLHELLHDTETQLAEKKSKLEEAVRG